MWENMGSDSPALTALKTVEPKTYEVFKALFMAGVASMVLNVVEIMATRNEEELLRICMRLLMESREYVDKTLRGLTGKSADSSAGVVVPPELKL
jgi:hypothetical protein